MTLASSRLALPYISPAQAQKHVTHNEALRQLDQMVQLVLTGVGVDIPPTTPVEGEVYALGTAPESAWAGQDAGTLAQWDGSAWGFVVPATGWIAARADTADILRFDGAGWAPLAVPLSDLDGVGIGTGWDAVNRLSVASEASLFSHAGGSHQMKLNKAASGDTASLLFQSNWTGHAEIGLAGDTALSVKVSADGSTWTQALRVDDTAAQIDVAVTGTAVQDTATDTAPSKLMKVGAFGLGGAGPKLTDWQDYIGHARFAQGDGGQSVNFPRSSARYFPCLVLNRNESGVQNETHISWGTRVFYGYTEDGGATWENHELYSTRNVLGTVSEDSGAPTGAIVERGTNVNGRYVRFADGTQICTRSVQIDGLSVTSPTGGVFRSSIGNYDFPAAFRNGQADFVTATIGASEDGNVRNAVGFLKHRLGSSVQDNSWSGMAVWSGYAFTGTAGDITHISLFAIGRWF